MRPAGETEVTVWRIALPGWRGLAASRGALMVLVRHLAIDWPGIPAPPGLRAVKTPAPGHAA